MTKGWFKVMTTIKNTGTQAFEAFVVLRIMDPSGQEHLGWLGKKGLNPGQSSQFQASCFDGDIEAAADWPSGTYTYRVNLYDKVISQGNFIGTLPDGWLTFQPGSFTLDETAFLAGKQGTLTI